MARLIDRRLLWQALILVGRTVELPNRRFKAAKLPFDGFLEVLQQVEPISDLPGLRCALARRICIETSAIAAVDRDNPDGLSPLDGLDLQIRRG
jgi:hypothetical protein